MELVCDLVLVVDMCSVYPTGPIGLVCMLTAKACGASKSDHNW